MAQLDYSKDIYLPYIDSFHDACSQLRYRDIMALSRALQVHPRTIESWKYHEKLPKMEFILHVIDWVKQGKPMESATPASNTGMV